MSKTVVYTCPFVPAEWIRAHGLEPSRLAPRLNGAGISSVNGVCPYSAAFVEAAVSQDAAAVIVTTACDQMRRSYEQIAARSGAPVFLMNIPHTWQSPGSHKLYRQELERMGRFLTELGGCVASVARSRCVPQRGTESLAEVMADYDTARASIRDSRPFLPARQHSELIAAFNHNPDAYLGVDRAAQPFEAPRGVPLAVVGGPLVREAYPIFAMVEKAGGYVALDATETGERTLPAPFDRRRLREDPLGTLCDAYFGAIPDPMRRPNSEFFKWLGVQISERGIRGIVLMHYVWCDTWRAEAQRISQWSGLPFLPLDIGDSGPDPTRTLTRLEAFLEVLR